VPPDDATRLAQELERLLGSGEMQAQFAARGRLKAEARFDLKKSVATLAGVYRQSAATGNGARRADKPHPREVRATHEA
jgi:hypothetical protein